MKGKWYSLRVTKPSMSKVTNTQAQKGGGWAETEHFSKSENNTYLGKDERSLSRYSPSAFWIFPRRSASLSRDRCTPWMLRTSITSGDFDTFFISARNSVLILQTKPKSRSALCEGRRAAPCGPEPSRPWLQASPLEALRFHRQQVLDVCTACEDAFQVDPAPLDVDPHVKEGHDAVQLVFPAQGVLLENLAGRRKEELDCYPEHMCQTH